MAIDMDRHRAMAALKAALSLACSLGGMMIAGCSQQGDAPALSSAAPSAPDVPVPPEDGPKLGSLALLTPVLDRPSKDGARLGFLHAGAHVTRAEKPFSTEGCPGGWFPIRPRGLICADQGVSLDGANPALSAMTPPNMAGPLPYTYVRTVRKTSLYEMSAEGLKPAGDLLPRAGLAVVGSSRVAGAGGKPVSLAMTTSGRVVNAVDLEAAREIGFQGVEVGEGKGLPVGFIVKESVDPIRVTDGKVEKLSPLERLSIVSLTGKSHNRGPEKYFATGAGTYLRNRDVVTVFKRDKYPDFVRDDTRWIDVSTVMGTLVLYEGKKPVFATLVSTGTDRHGGSKETHLGTFFVTGKQVTVDAPPAPLDEQHDVHDVPWAIELSSGQIIHASYWHSRFGLPHGTGNLQLSPSDAARVFQWVQPQLPEGWHGAQADADGATRTPVFIHK
jgi:hypothetical protein